MKAFSALFIIIALSFSVFASEVKVDKSVTLDKLKKVNLVGMQLIEKQTNAESFGYKLLAARSIDSTNAKIIKDSYSGKIVSRLFVLGEPSSFKNILVFIGNRELDKKLQLVVLFVNKDSTFTLDFDITKIEAKKIHVNNGPKGEEDLYFVTAPKLFP